MLGHPLQDLCDGSEGEGGHWGGESMECDMPMGHLLTLHLRKDFFLSVFVEGSTISSYNDILSLIFWNLLSCLGNAYKTVKMV